MMLPAAAQPSGCARAERHRRQLSLAVMLLCACASAPQQPATDSPAGALQYERVITPVVVLDESGRPYELPFLGGFDVPRPQFVDIDADGDLDLFVQERSRHIMYFENTGSAARARLVWRSDRWQDVDIGEWYRFVDVDGDGAYDVLGEAPYSHIRLYRNAGDARRPRMVLAADTLRDVAGKPIFADRQNIANAIDLDCDGLLDLFLGRVDGTITRYEAVSRGGDGGVPRFQFVTDRFEDIEIVAQIGSRRHGANTMFFADHDGDGDPDLYWGDFFEPGVLLIRNQGTCATPNLRSVPEPLRDAAGAAILTSGYNAPVLADINGDGTKDLLIGVIGGAFNPNRTSSDNLLHFERTARGFEHRSSRFLSQLDVGSESTVTFGDVNGDGLADMLVGSKLDPQLLRHARLYLFLQERTAGGPQYRLADTLDLAPSFHYAPALADLNADGRPDLLLGTWSEGVLLYWNRGPTQEPQWVPDTARTVRLTRGSNATPALVDLDGDGDLDLMVGEAAGVLNFYRNVGSAAEPRFELVSDNFEGIDVGRRSHAAFDDIDGDGDFDMIVGRDEGGVAFFRNTGSRTVPRFALEEGVSLPLPPLAAPIFHDLTGDGTRELVLGNLSGGIIVFAKR